MSDRVPPDAVGVGLDAYFARIGYSGPRAPTLEVLRALHALHPAAIPFENLDVLAGRTIEISPAAVDDKLIARRRGGFCFEHNGLFKRVLVAIGFEVDSLAARVLWMAPEEGPPRPRTHMALRVMIDGTPWLADVGFGGCVPTAPLRLDSEEPQETAWETFRILPSGAQRRLEALLDGVWRPLYELALSPADDADWELANWFVCSHPTSHFRTHLMGAFTSPEARYALRDGQLTIRRRNGEVERRELDAAQLQELLCTTFGLPAEAHWRHVPEQLIAPRKS
jgi:N-hydroxyarylamine O-acetyltransferase